VLHEPFVTCQSPCHCRPPEGVGGYSGEQRMGTCCGPCEDSSESSDSQPSDSESSGSESSGSGSCLRWTQSGTYNTCDEWGCICPEPERPPAYYGEIILTCCNCTPPYGECDGFDCPHWCMPLDPRCAWRSIPC
jgi:hypothetical protein